MKASTIIEKAKSFIGTTEYPPNSNNVIFNTDYYGKPIYGDNFPWCMTFVWDIFRMCGASELFYDGQKTASCPELMEWAKRTGQFVTGEYKEGDVLIMDFDDEKDGDHTGFCIRDNGSDVTTVEGNTSSNNYGSQSNGGGVFERTRSKSVITGAYRPKYDVDLSKGEWVKGEKGGWRYRVGTTFVRNKWKQIDGAFYYFKANGYIATDEYIKSSMYKMTQELFYLDKDGKWDGKTYKWHKNDVGWWLECEENGWYPTKSWAVIDGKTYRFDSKGYMVHGRTVLIEGKKYTFADDGALIK